MPDLRFLIRAWRAKGYVCRNIYILWLNGQPFRQKISPLLRLQKGFLYDTILNMSRIDTEEKTPKEKKIKTLAELFFVFFKIGLFTFGGGYAMISIIESECAKRGWADEKDIMNMVTLAESTPGVIAVSSATFIGYKVAGFFGALVSTFAVALPSFILISTLYFLFDAMYGNPYVTAAFKGLRACVAVLIVNAFITLFSKADKTPLNYVIMVAAFAYSLFTPFSVIYIILLALAAGALTGFIKGRKEGAK